MDVFEENHICNHTDDEGRYAYKVCFLSLSLLSSDLCSDRPRVEVPAHYDVS